MNDATVIKIVAIVAIAVLESAALISHTDGAFFGPAIAIIGGIAGYELRGMNLKTKEVTDEAR